MCLAKDTLRLAVEEVAVAAVADEGDSSKANGRIASVSGMVNYGRVRQRIKELLGRF